MPNHPSSPPPRVTLEDLLRLKRAERPPAEFWIEFERELQQKQLAALVERKSWWHGLAACYSRCGRLRVPLGTAAILALTLLSVRHYFPSGADPRPADGTASINRPAASPAIHQRDQARPVVAAAPAGEGATVMQTPASGGEHALPPAVANAPVMAGEVPGLISGMGGIQQGQAKVSGLMPSVPSLAVNLVAASAIEPELVEALSRPHGFEERAVPPARPQHVAEVLPTAVAVAEPRRARLLAALGSAGAYAPEPAAPEHARRSVSRYLAQDGWDRSMSRLAAEGDRLSIKF